MFTEREIGWLTKLFKLPIKFLLKSPCIVEFFPLECLSPMICCHCVSVCVEFTWPVGWFLSFLPTTVNTNQRLFSFSRVFYLELVRREIRVCCFSGYQSGTHKKKSPKKKSSKEKWKKSVCYSENWFWWNGKGLLLRKYWKRTKCIFNFFETKDLSE